MRLETGSSSEAELARCAHAYDVRPRRDPQPRRRREHDRREQHDRRVEAQHRGHRRGDEEDEREQPPRLPARADGQQRADRVEQPVAAAAARRAPAARRGTRPSGRGRRARRRRPTTRSRRRRRAAPRPRRPRPPRAPTAGARRRSRAPRRARRARGSARPCPTSRGIIAAGAVGARPSRPATTRQVVCCSFGASRGSSWISRSARGTPAASSRDRSRSALSSMPEQQRDVREPHPHEQDHDAAERAVGLVVGAEVRDVEREQRPRPRSTRRARGSPRA